MTKVYSIGDRMDYLMRQSDLFDKKFNQKDYLSALLIVDSLEKNGGSEIDLCVKRAKVFFEMERYSQAIEEWFKYLSISKTEKHFAKAYNALGACFYRLGDEKVAGYYFNSQIMSDKKARFDYSYVTAEFYEELLSADKNYYLAYPYEKADFSKLLQKCENMLKSGDYDGAISGLSVIPKTNEFYPIALVTLSIAKYFKGDVKGALLDIENSITLKPCALSICNAISMFTSEKQEEKAEFYASMLETTPIESEEDIYKVAMIYCERGEHEKAKINAVKYLKTSPFDASMLLILGMIEYNLKNYKGAEEAFKKAYQINRGYVAKYYLKLSETKKYDELDYSYDIQPADRLKSLKLITSLMKADSEERLLRQDEIYGISNYAFSTSSYELQSSAVTLLGEIATETAVDIMKNSLISVTVYDRIKAGILGFLTADGFDGKLGASFGNIYRQITFYKADFGKDDRVFTEAYSYVFAKLAPMERDMEPIKISAQYIFDVCKEKGVLDKISDVRSLSAVMYELSSIANIKSRREFASFFEANLKEIKRIKTMIQENLTDSP